MFFPRLSAVALAAACLLGGQAAVAQTQTQTEAQTQASAAGSVAPYAVPPQEAADAARVQQIMLAVRGSGPAGLRRSLSELRQIAGRAPVRYPVVEVQGPYTIVRSDVVPMSMTIASMLQAAGEGRQTALVSAFNTYGMARLMLASYAVETRQYDEALRELNAGLAMQPDNGFMISEKAAALEALHRPADALATISPWLEAHPMASGPERALLLRGKGYALVELNRLDEAETAYKGSLALQPDHKGAQSELQYIAQRRGGQAVGTPVQIMTSDKAATVGPTPAPAPAK